MLRVLAAVVARTDLGQGVVVGGTSGAVGCTDVGEDEGQGLQEAGLSGCSPSSLFQSKCPHSRFGTNFPLLTYHHWRLSSLPPCHVQNHAMHRKGQWDEVGVLSPAVYTFS